MDVFAKSKKFIRLSGELRKLKKIMNEQGDLGMGARSRDFQRVKAASHDYECTLRKIEDLALTKH